MNLEESIKLAVQSCEAQLYDIVTVKENDKNIYRVLVTSPDGINLDKCAEISRMISPLLDVNEPMSGEYNLEVSSPGIERKLKKVEHFKASVGESVKIKDIATEVYKGKLISASDDEIVVQTEFGAEKISYNSILSAATYFEW